MECAGDPRIGERLDRGSTLNTFRPVVYFIPAVVYAGLIFYLSGQPALRALKFAHSDKLLHALAFGGLAYLVAWGFIRARPGWSLLRVLVAAFVITVIYGCLDELHQSLTPRRQPDPLDVVADSIGALGAALIFWWISRKKPGAAAFPDQKTAPKSSPDEI